MLSLTFCHKAAPMDISLMPAADTKSVVLALQGLQEKIRRLEEDRNFHREECEKAHIAHEAYKREVEDQLERERTEHRRRESELQRMISEAKQERTEMSRSMEDSRLELRKFREQLDGIMDHERSTHEEREGGLRRELDECQRAIREESSKISELKHTIANLRSEREVVLSTNKRLEATVADLISMNTKLLDGGRVARRPTSGVSAQTRTRSAHQDPNTSTSSSQRYLAPTASSYARAASTERGTPRGPAAPRPRSAPRASSVTRAARSSGLQDVYDELEEEYIRLLSQYKEMRRAHHSPSQMEAVAQLLEEKGEQLKMMRGTATTRGTHTAVKTPRGTNKAVQRGALVAKVNQLFKNADR